MYCAIILYSVIEMISKIGRDLEGHSQNNLMLFTNLFKFLWISPKLKS